MFINLKIHECAAVRIPLQLSSHSPNSFCCCLWVVNNILAIYSAFVGQLPLLAVYQYADSFGKGNSHAFLLHILKLHIA